MEASPGRCVISYRVKEEDTNKGMTMHGGLGATLVDIVSTMALADADTGQLLRPGVSVDMGIT